MKLPIKIDLRRSVVINQWISLINGVCLLSIIFLSLMPQPIAVLFIAGWTVTIAFTVVWALASVFRQLSLLCPFCRSEVPFGGGSITCPKCGPIRCRGWLKVRCERGR